MYYCLVYVFQIQVEVHQIQVEVHLFPWYMSNKLKWSLGLASKIRIILGPFNLVPRSQIWDLIVSTAYGAGTSVIFRAEQLKITPCIFDKACSKVRNIHFSFDFHTLNTVTHFGGNHRSTLIVTDTGLSKNLRNIPKWSPPNVPPRPLVDALLP